MTCWRLARKGTRRPRRRIWRRLSRTAPPSTWAGEAAYGRLELSQGNVARAEQALRHAMEVARQEGRVSDEMRDGSALSWALVELEQRFADARELLSEMRPAGESYPEGEAWLAYNEGSLALAMGDQRRAIASYRTAERGAQRLDRRKLAGNAGEELARILGDLGRSDEALAILWRAPVDPDRCSTATSKLNRGWIMMERCGPQSPRARSGDLVGPSRGAFGGRQLRRSASTRRSP